MQQLIRLWVNDVDYGTMTERAGQMYSEMALKYGDICRFEPVADDAPEFLHETDVSLADVLRRLGELEVRVRKLEEGK